MSKNPTAIYNRIVIEVEALMVPIGTSDAEQIMDGCKDLERLLLKLYDVAYSMRYPNDMGLRVRS